jgi:hypothetical protein
MKSRLAFLLLVLHFGLVMVTVGQVTVQAGISNPSGSTLAISAKPSQAIDNGLFSGFNATLKWLTSYGITLGTPTGSYGIGAAGGVQTSGLYSYQDFASTPNVYITWGAGSENVLFSVPVQGGVGTGTFELDIAGVGGGLYFELNAVDIANSTTPFYQAAVNNVPLPVELTSFVVIAKGTSAELTWKTATEKNCYGFQVQRQKEGGQGYADVANGFVAGHGTTNVPQSYSFTDQNAAGGPWSYRLKQVDLDGTVAYYYPNGSNGTTTSVKVEEKPKEYSLGQNYPNPFNPTTRIRYALPHDTQVRLEVFNVIGQRVATLVDAPQPAGYYDRVFDAAGLPSGLYFYRLVTPEVNFLKKMMLLK